MIDLRPKIQPTAQPATQRKRKPAGYVYLACPYTHPDQAVQLERVELASIVAARIMLNGFAVYSPITHGHVIAQHLPRSAETGHEFWMDQCLPLVAKADALIVLPMAGWRKSSGVGDEMAFAAANGIRIGMVQAIAYPWQDQLDKVLDVEMRIFGAEPVIGLERAGLVEHAAMAAAQEDAISKQWGELE